MNTPKKGSFSEWKQRTAFSRAEWNRRYARYYMVYIALIGTGVLSSLTGILLPFSQDSDVPFLVGLAAGLYFSVGFLTNGEIAANYWFGKLTDHDPDSTGQRILAVVSLGVSIIVSLVTALASSLLIAFWLGIFPEFAGIPSWAQVWVVDIIPVMWIFHAVMGMAFKALSAEATMERISKAYIREKQNELEEARNDAMTEWWRENAKEAYEQAGREQAKEDLSRRFSKSTVESSNSTVGNTRNVQMRPAGAFQQNEPVLDDLAPKGRGQN